MKELFKEEVKNIIDILDSTLGTSERYDISSEIYVEDMYDDLSVVKSYTDSIPGCRILDFGCGKGHISALSSVLLEKKIEGVDLFESFGEGGKFNCETLGPEWQRSMWSKLSEKYNVEYSYYDGNRVPKDDGIYDAIIAYAVIEHVLDEEKFLREANRLLKPGGRLFIFRCPNKLSYTENLAKLMGVPHHDRLYSKAKLEKLFSSCNFDTVYIDKYDTFFSFSPDNNKQSIWNKLLKIHKFMRKLLILPPFKVFAHHFRAVLVKK